MLVADPLFRMSAAVAPATGNSGAHSSSTGMYPAGMEMKDGSYFQRYENLRNPAVLGPLRFMEFEHLSNPYLRDLSSKFADLACHLLDALPDDPELTKALDNLRAAKDRAVGLAAVTIHSASDDQAR